MFEVRDRLYFILYVFKVPRASQAVLVIKNLPANTGDMCSIPGLGRSPGGGNGYPLQYSCLGNSMDTGAWQAVHGGTELDTTSDLAWTKFQEARKVSAESDLNDKEWPTTGDLVAQMVKHLPAMQETWVWSLGCEDSLEKETATHSMGNFMEKGGWWATVHGVSKSQIWLSN